MTEGAQIVNTPSNAAFAIAECEGPGDRDGIVAAIDNGSLPDCELAIVTNHGGLIVKKPNGETDIEASRALAKPLVDAGFVCLNEVYLRTDEGLSTGRTVESMHRIATEQLGFPSSQPVFGVFGGARLLDYQQWFNWPGWSVYIAEAVL